jgi:hypothetical protein
LIGINIVFVLQLRSVRQLEMQALAKRDETINMNRQLKQRYEAMVNARATKRFSLDSKVSGLVRRFRTDQMQDFMLEVMEQLPTQHVLQSQPSRTRVKPCSQYWIKMPEKGHTLVLKISRIVNRDPELNIEDHPVLPGDVEWLKFPLDPGQVYRVDYKAESEGSKLTISLNDKVVLEKRVPGQTLQSGGLLQSGHNFLASDPGIVHYSSALMYEKNYDLLQQGYWSDFGYLEYNFSSRQDGEGDPSLSFFVQNYLQFEGDIYRSPKYFLWAPSEYLDHLAAPKPDQLNHPTYPDLIRIQKTGEADTEK